MTPEQLKASILQYAMKGKLTQQLEDDGTASDILPLLHIDSKITASEPPFDLPENWLWIPIGNLGDSVDTDSFADGPFGSNLKTVHYIDKPEVRIIQLSNIGEDGWKDKNVKYTSYQHLEEVIPRCEVNPGDFVIAKMMPAGRTIQVPDLGTRITLGSDAMKFVPNKVLNKQYLLWAMHSQAFLEQVYAEAHGITRVRTTLSGIKSYVLPIPPLAEQKRIVAKIEELLPYVDRYAEAYEKLEQFNAKFPEDMQKSILQYAIQGKLVEQRPEEGTGEELYQQIQAEKQRLIKEGKIKKEKPLPEITEDEIPFDIPESWKWVYVGDIFAHNTGKAMNSSAKRVEKVGSIRPFITTSNLYWNKFDFSTVKEMFFSDNELDRCTITKGDLLMNEGGAYFGRTAIWNFDYDICFQNHVHRLRPYLTVELMYFYHVFYFYRNMNMMRAKGTAMPGLSSVTLHEMIIPLPPLAEQKRIVAKLEEILPLCERLK